MGLQKSYTATTISSLKSAFRFAAAVIATLFVLHQPLSAEIIVSEVNQTATLGGGAVSLDLNGDDVFDFRFEVTTIENTEIGRVTSLSEQSLIPEVLTSGGQALAIPNDAILNDALVLTKQQWASSGSLYANTFGTLGEIGTTAVIGLRLRDNQSEDPPRYGLLEVTRGSLSLGTSAFSTTAGAGVPVSSLSATNTAVPEPSSFAILSLGIAGFGLRRYRRRRSSVASVQEDKDSV